MSLRIGSAVLSFFMVASAWAGSGAIRPVRPDDAAGTSSAVVVDGGARLLHTRQLTSVGPGEPAESVLEQLDLALRDAQSSVEMLVKVDVYLARNESLVPFQKAFARRIGGKGHPAISYVVGGLPRPGAAVALDAVAVTSMSEAKSNRGDAVLPAGPRYYVSGQADPDDDLASATRKTLNGLDGTLKYLGLDRSRIVRLKAFMQPMTAASVTAVEREVEAFFEGKGVPPLSLVEWRSSPKQPIEIELIAAGRERTHEAFECLTPPDLKPSPVFSRVARVGAGAIIYISGLYGEASASGAGQVEAIFASLGRVLAESGSDFRRLVKATYYVSDADANRALTDIRPRNFDPKRPPAASKAFVASVGLEGRSITLDMIAVPAGN